MSGSFFMNVTVKLFSSFRIRWGKEIIGEYPQGASVADIAAAIGIPADTPFIKLVNGRHASLNDIVHEGDVVTFMPLIGGG